MATDVMEGQHDGERTAAEEALRASEERFRQVFDGGADQFLIHDRVGRLVDVNVKATEALGYSRTELLTMAISDIDVGLDSDALRTIWDQVATGRDVTVESAHRRKDGTVFPVDVHVTQLRQGNELLMFAIARDITARKAAEAETRIAERRLALAISATADAIWEYNVETGCSYYSPRWYEMIGQPGASFPVTREAWREICHPEDYIRTIEGLLQAFGNDEQAYGEVEYRAKHADGSWIWLMQRGSVVERDSHGAPVVVAGTVSDITRRRVAESANLAWKQRYDLLSLAAGQVVYDYRPSGEISWTGVYEQLLGYRADEMQGGFAQWLDRVHPDERTQILGQVTALEEQGKSFELEYRLRRSNGDYLLVRDLGYPQFDEQGKVARYVGVLTDITEKRRNERERERLEESLRQAQKMESIGRLAGGVAHDFNNLLTAIGGNLQLALAPPHSTEEMRELLLEAQKAVDSAANLTRQLLAFSRKQVIRPTLINLNDVVVRVQKMLVRLLGEDVRLRVSIADGLGFVRIDEGQVEQILINLAINARDAMPEGGSLTLLTENAFLDDSFCEDHDMRPGPHVALIVSDDGCGMSAAIQARLFEPFFTTKTAGKGTGLGLAMVYGAVRQNGGCIAVSSEVGHGTTFRIYLPRVDEPEAAPNPIIEELPSTGSETVALVEDDEQVRHLAVRILEHLGYHVYAFGSGKEALESLSSALPHVDLLLTDVIMPEMNGRTLAHQMQALYPEIRVLYASGYDDDVIVHHGVLDEGINFLPKPYTVSGLAKSVRDVLDRRPVARGSSFPRVREDNDNGEGSD